MITSVQVRYNVFSLSSKYTILRLHLHYFYSNGSSMSSSLCHFVIFYHFLIYRLWHFPPARSETKDADSCHEQQHSTFCLDIWPAALQATCWQQSASGLRLFVVFVLIMLTCEQTRSTQADDCGKANNAHMNFDRRSNFGWSVPSFMKRICNQKDTQW